MSNDEVRRLAENFQIPQDEHDGEMTPVLPPKTSTEFDDAAMAFGLNEFEMGCGWVVRHILETENGRTVWRKLNGSYLIVKPEEVKFRIGAELAALLILCRESKIKPLDAIKAFTSAKGVT